MNKQMMILLSIVGQGRGQKLIDELVRLNVKMNFQSVGLGTAPTEMLDIFGLGSNDKDIIVSLAARSEARSIMSNFGEVFPSHSKFGGIMIFLEVSAASRLLCELLNYNNENKEKEAVNMHNEHHNNLIIIAVNEGYSQDVMNAARKAGATGGTVIKGRLADTEHFAELIDSKATQEREMLCILAPPKISKQIMEEVNSQFGMTSAANGVIFAVPAEKAFKI